MPQQYGYIITGAGCAGLSLLRRMMHSAFFRSKKILLIDKEDKRANDRTWCFWEKQPGYFEPIVYHRWPQIAFYSNDFSARFDLAPYQYKMIRGIDLYTSVIDEAKLNANIDILTENVLSVLSNETYAAVKTKEKEFHADYVFNSIFFNDWKQDALQKKNMYVLLQHFKGWLIETNEYSFDDAIATFMDFRVDQKRGTTFIYVMPVSKNEALIEYTLFTPEVLPEQEYDVELSNYIRSVLGIKKYTVNHTEFGVIPMTNYTFPKGEGRIVNIGTAGGQTKSSSGYTFQFIQKHSDKIIHALTHSSNPLIKDSFFNRRFNLYDRIFLNVLYNKKMRGDK